MDLIRFDVYGRFVIGVTPTAEGWRIARLGADGKRSILPEILPPDTREDEIADRLEVLFHELGSPDTQIRRVEQP